MNLSAMFSIPGTSKEAINPFLDPARERRIALYAERAEKNLGIFTGQAPPPERDPREVAKEFLGADRLALLPMLDDLEDEFDEVVEGNTTKNLLRCEHYSVDALDLTIRARRSLYDFGIETIGELCAYTQAELRKAFGTVAVGEILDRLNKHGIVLAPT